jgi:hypothetical protein
MKYEYELYKLFPFLQNLLVGKDSLRILSYLHFKRTTVIHRLVSVYVSFQCVEPTNKIGLHIAIAKFIWQ